MVLILDFGSQFTQLIARRVRELNVYCEIHPYNNIPEIKEPLGALILSGSPFSVHSEDAPSIDFTPFQNIPTLGICFGAQYLAHTQGGEVKASNTREYGRARLSAVNHEHVLLTDVPQNSQVWMSHGDSITSLGNDFQVIASTEDVHVAAFEKKNEQVYGLQFHPEVYHSEHGKNILANFLYRVAQIEPNWTPASYVDEAVADIKAQVGDEEVLLGLSGGVDSSVAALLLHKALGDQLICVFVDNGLLRKNEFDDVLDSYQGMGLNVIGVQAKEEFYKALDGVEDPEAKRKAIGNTFIEVFDKSAEQLEDVKWLAQGTIYPDVIESVSVNGPSDTIKSHHNVGGLPDFMKLKIIEPLRPLFKDEVRRVGAVLGLKDEILHRHPFPGPGLGIRILGDITEEKVRILQEVDYIYINKLKEYNLYNEIWQAGAILLPVKSVGVMGDERTYENAVALRAVTSTDGMTADWYHLPYDLMAEVSNEIINKVRGINRVVYDISSKPPATIEWE